MSRIKSIFLSFLMMLASFIMLVSFFLLPFVHNNLARILILQFAQSDNVKIKACNVRLGLEKIEVTDLDFSIFESKIQIPILKIEYSLPELLTRLKTGFDLASDEIIINDDKVILSGSMFGVYNHRTETLSLTAKMDSKFVKEINNCNIKKLSLSTGFEFSPGQLAFRNFTLNINEGVVKSDINLLFAEKKLNEINVQAELYSLPLNLYKLLVNEEHDVHKFFEESIEGGEISTAKILVQIPSEYVKGLSEFSTTEIHDKFLDKYVKANFKIANIAYKYSNYMPPIRANMLELSLKGRNAVVDIKNSFLGKTKLIEGNVSFDYLAESLVVLATGDATGRAQDLVSFIDPISLKKMTNSHIELQNLKGLAESKINIEIPIAKDKPNKYDIKTKITNLNGKLLKDRVSLKDYKIEGNFDGKKVILDCIGKLNGFVSKINLLVNLDGREEISHKLTGKINLGKTDVETFGMKVLGGHSEMNLEIVAKKDTTNLLAKADFTNLHFFIPSIALDKASGKKATFKLDGKLIEGTSQNLNIKLAGDDGLSISGTIQTYGQISKLNFDEVKYLNNNFKAEITTGGKSLLALVKGGLLDLSQANLFEFIKGEESKIDDVKLNVHLDVIKLKNNITLTQTMIDAECNKDFCPVARFNSSIGSNIVRVEFENLFPKPKWRLETNDAGMLFSGLGLSNNIKKGQLNVAVDAPLSMPYNLNYSTSGTFLLTNFGTTQNKFLTRMVSFISIPGLVSSITNNNIQFDKLSGDISIQNGQYYLSNVIAEGPYFNFHAKGKIDSIRRKVDIKGQVVPSLYGLNKLMGSLPLLKALFGKKGGVIFTPFFINEEY